MREHMFAGLTVVMSVACMPAGQTPAFAQTPAPTGQTAGQTASQPAAPPASKDAAQAKPNLGGVWKLNPQLSDAVRPAARGRDGDGGGRPGGYGGGSGGMGGGRGMPGGRMGGGGGGMRGGGYGGAQGGSIDPEQMKEMRALMEEVMEMPSTLTISEGDQAATFTYPDGRSITYKTDGRKEKHQATHATVETRTKWEEAGLVIETELGHGVKARHVYSLDADPRQLVVLVSFAGGRGRESSGRRYVYDDSTAASQP